MGLYSTLKHIKDVTFNNIEYSIYKEYDLYSWSIYYKNGNLRIGYTGFNTIVDAVLDVEKYINNVIKPIKE